MRKAIKLRIVFAHLLMAALILVVALVPNHRRNVADPTAFFVAIGIIEVGDFRPRARHRAQRAAPVA